MASTAASIINVAGFGALTAAQQPNNFFGYAGTGGLRSAEPVHLRRQVEIPVHDVRAAAVRQSGSGVPVGRQGARRLTAYTNAISAHIDFVNARNLDNNRSRPRQISSAEKAAFLARSAHRARRRHALTITQIMSQKYIAQWAWGHNELWMDMRRYHYTDIDPATGAQIYPGFAPPTARFCTRTTTARSRSAFGRDTTRSTSGTSRRCRRSAATSSITTRSPSGSLNRNRPPFMTRIPTSSRLLLGVAVLVACSKDGVQDIAAPAAGAFIKFYNFGVNAPVGELLRQRHEGDGDQLDELPRRPNAAERRRATTGDRIDDGHGVRRARERRLYSSIAAGSSTRWPAKSRRRRTRTWPSRSVELDARRREVLLVLRAASTMRPPRRSTRSSSKMRFRRSSTSLTASVRFVNASLELAADDAVREEHRHRPSRASDRRWRTSRRARSSPCRAPCTI